MSMPELSEKEAQVLANARGVLGRFWYRLLMADCTRNEIWRVVAAIDGIEEVLQEHAPPPAE